MYFGRNQWAASHWESKTHFNSKRLQRLDSDRDAQKLLYFVSRPKNRRSVDGCAPCRETRREQRLSPENICQVVQVGLALAGQPLLIHYVFTEYAEHTEGKMRKDCERAFLKMLMTKLIKAFSNG